MVVRVAGGAAAEWAVYYKIRIHVRSISRSFCDLFSTENHLLRSAIGILGVFLKILLVSHPKLMENMELCHAIP